MSAFLILGFLIGMSHAFEADHLAAIGTLATSDKATPKRLAFLGASWGMGHTTTLFIISMIVIVFGAVLSERLAAGIEFIVGIMLILLGLEVFWKMKRKKIHFHLHQHGDGKKHFHAHSHLGSNVAHNEDTHEHNHATSFSLRAYLVGLVHGAAGSASLVALTAAATQDIIKALLYILLFGIGSILGMAVLTFSASWPLKMIEKSMAGILRFIQAGIALIAIFIGFNVMYGSGQIIWGAT